jgi:hypothetical protein
MQSARRICPRCCPGEIRGDYHLGLCGDMRPSALVFRYAFRVAAAAFVIAMPLELRVIFAKRRPRSQSSQAKFHIS